jgi:hypothetical protein
MVAVITASAARGATTVHVAIGEARTAFFDTDGNGMRLGERIASRGPLQDATRTERVGTSYQECVVHKRILDPNVGLWNCDYVLELADGEIILKGLDPRGPGEYEMAVLGGTGAYAGASGDATFTDVDAGPDSYTDMVIRL